MAIDGHFMQADINWRNNSILKSIKIEDSFIPGEIDNLTDHVISLNRWLIKVMSLNKTITLSFG